MRAGSDPGLGNRYLFGEGRYRGRVGLWAGATEGGAIIEWELRGRESSGGQSVVPFDELRSAKIIAQDEPAPKLTPCSECRGRGRWGPGATQHCILCRATGYAEGALAGYDVPKAPAWGYEPVD